MRRTSARRGWFPGNLKVVRAAIAGLQPIVTGYTGALDAAQSHGMAGRVGSVVIGEPSSPGWKFSGYLAWDRTARIPVGASTNLRYSPDTLYPSTSPATETSFGSAVMDHLAQLTPGGYRR
jgi:hypothetical protein